jgi:hypothetical protein
MFGGWQLRTKGRSNSTSSINWEWTRNSSVGGGAIFENQREVFSPKQRRGNEDLTVSRERTNAQARRCEPIRVRQFRRRP